jgi:hypothetical protein
MLRLTQIAGASQSQCFLAAIILPYGSLSEWYKPSQLSWDIFLFSPFPEVWLFATFLR